MKIGIIGGVSPFAFSQFYNMLCEKYRKISKGIYPELLIYSIQVSDKQENAFLENNINKEIQSELEKEIEKACNLFQDNKIETIIICCNTLSNIFYNIANKYDFKNIITPVNSVISYIEEVEFKNTLLLATGYTNKNLYLELDSIIHLNEAEQKVVEDFIKNKINNIRDKKKEFNEIINNYNSSIDSIILGCTDIEKGDLDNIDKIKILDSVELMINKTLKIMR